METLELIAYVAASGISADLAAPSDPATGARAGQTRFASLSPGGRRRRGLWT